MLPNHDDFPSSLPQKPYVFLVPENVILYLRNPVFPVRLRRFIVKRTLMPEASVYENGRLRVGQYYVWASVNLRVHRVLHAESLQNIMDGLLLLRPLATYPRHSVASLLPCQVVRHKANSVHFFLSLFSSALAIDSHRLMKSLASLLFSMRIFIGFFHPRNEIKRSYRLR